MEKTKHAQNIEGEKIDPELIIFKLKRLKSRIEELLKNEKERTASHSS